MLVGQDDGVSSMPSAATQRLEAVIARAEAVLAERLRREEC